MSGGSLDKLWCSDGGSRVRALGSSAMGSLMIAGLGLACWPKLERSCRRDSFEGLYRGII